MTISGDNLIRKVNKTLSVTFSSGVKPVYFAINPISKNSCWKYQFLAED
jgi:hypothetical protein